MLSTSTKGLITSLFNDLMYMLVRRYYDGTFNNFDFSKLISTFESDLYEAYKQELISERNLYDFLDKINVLMMLNNDLNYLREIKPKLRN